MRPKLFGAAMAAALLIGTAALADCNPNDRESQTGNANTTRCDSGTPSSATGRGMGTNSGGNNAPMKGAPYNGSGTDGGTNKGTYGGSTPNTTTPGSGSGDATGGAGSGPSSSGGGGG
jgi:hypothetical protein